MAPMACVLHGMHARLQFAYPSTWTLPGWTWCVGLGVGVALIHGSPRFEVWRVCSPLHTFNCRAPMARALHGTCPASACPAKHGRVRQHSCPPGQDAELAGPSSGSTLSSLSAWSSKCWEPSAMPATMSMHAAAVPGTWRMCTCPQAGPASNASALENITTAGA